MFMSAFSKSKGCSDKGSGGVGVGLGLSVWIGFTVEKSAGGWLADVEAALQPAWLMGRNGLFMSEAVQLYPASATSRMQHPSVGDAT